MMVLLANTSLVFDVMKVWYIDWLPVRNPQAKKERKEVPLTYAVKFVVLVYLLLLLLI